MQWKNRVAALLLSLMMALSLAAPAWAAEVAASGECGEDLIWTLTENGTLTVSGTGAMTWGENDLAPWYELRGSIVNAVLADGVTNIGRNAFRGCALLAGVRVPTSVTGVGDAAFYGCKALTDVYYSGSRAQWAKIELGEENGRLTDGSVRIHCTDDAAAVEGCFKGGELVAAYTAAPAGTRLIAACCDGNGRLADVRIVAVAAHGEMRLGMNRKPGHTFRLMLAGGASFAPLCAAWTCAVPDLATEQNKIYINLGAEKVSTNGITNGALSLTMEPGDIIMWGLDHSKHSAVVYENGVEVSRFDFDCRRDDKNGGGMIYDYLVSCLNDGRGGRLKAGAEYFVVVDGKYMSNIATCSAAAAAVEPAYDSSANSARASALAA